MDLWIRRRPRSVEDDNVDGGASRHLAHEISTRDVLTVNVGLRHEFTEHAILDASPATNFAIPIKLAPHRYWACSCSIERPSSSVLHALSKRLMLESQNQRDDSYQERTMQSRSRAR